MRWVEVFAVFLVCHLVGDYLLQTDRQARNKHGGLGRDATARRALTAHITSYTLAYVPAVLWLWGDLGAAALALLPAIAVPHLIQDDGRFILVYLREVKHGDSETLPFVLAMVDQTFHVLALFALALLVGSWNP